MNFKEYDLLVLLILGGLTTIILIIDVVNVLNADPSILDGAFLYGFLYLAYRLGISRPRE